ncbi:hypothetical protein [Nocardia sp. NPDC019304]|uniref:hypothetical protein n=1 Tax=unclassified Nocardia TaxID=2637762 RepID=UPI0033E5DA92
MTIDSPDGPSQSVRVIRGQVYYLPDGADATVESNWIPYGQVPDLGPIEVTKSLDDGTEPAR